MYRILMVCTGNICRSPMAEGLARFLLPDHLRASVWIESAGVSALHGNQAEPFAVEAMAQSGIDISSHRARQITADMARNADLILTMELGHQEMVRRMLMWKKAKVKLVTDFCPHSREPEIQDPYGGPLAAYQACIHFLMSCLGGLTSWLETRAGITPPDPSQNSRTFHG